MSRDCGKGRVILSKTLSMELRCANARVCARFPHSTSCLELQRAQTCCIIIATIVKPLALAICDQEVNKRILAVPHKVREEVSDKEMWNHSEPRDVRVSLPRRADESSEVRSSGNNVPPSASFDAETDEGRTIRLNNCAESP